LTMYKANGFCASVAFPYPKQNGVGLDMYSMYLRSLAPSTTTTWRTRCPVGLWISQDMWYQQIVRVGECIIYITKGIIILNRPTFQEFVPLHDCTMSAYSLQNPPWS
jgi:hypothetical protein